MSMSQANAALIIDTYAETSRLGITLTQAERMVDQASQRMGQKVDSSFGQVGNKVIKMLGAAVGAGLAIKVLDDALRKLADGIREGQGAQEIGLAIGDAVAESLKSVPVVGALGELAAMAFDPLMGGAMGTDEARRNAIAMQQARIDSEAEYQRLLALGATEEEARLAKKAEMEKAIRESAAKATEQFNQTEKKYDEEAYQRALKQAAEINSAMRGSAFGTVGYSPNTVQSVNREMFRTSESLTEEALSGRRRVNAAMETALKQVQMQFDRETADREARAASEMARAEKERAAQQERASEEEDRRIRAQEDAYDRFIRGNTQEAILALEGQLQQAGTAAAPSRGQRLADLMAGMGGGIATGDTALGAFTFATGSAAQISQGILDKATQQLAVLERIESIQRQIADMREGLN